jgi:hypothetical protein
MAEISRETLEDFVDGEINIYSNHCMAKDGSLRHEFWKGKW